MLPSSLVEMLVLRFGKGVRIIRVLIVWPVLSLVAYVEFRLESISKRHATVIRGIGCGWGGWRAGGTAPCTLRRNLQQEGRVVIAIDVNKNQSPIKWPVKSMID